MKNSALWRKRKAIWKRWHRLVNLRPAELHRFYHSQEGKQAGLSRSEARRQGISQGRASARALMQMLPHGKTFEAAKEDWSEREWKWAAQQVSFISRMRKARGPLKRHGRSTRKRLALKIWGHDPLKRMNPSLASGPWLWLAASGVVLWLSARALNRVMLAQNPRAVAAGVRG